MRTKPDNLRPLRSVVQPKQARSEDSLQRLLDAAESLLTERSIGEVSIADIARRARSSVGGFYARFRDKDELLLALHERFVHELEQRFIAIEASASEYPSLGELLRPSLQMLVDIYRARRPLLVAFASRASDNRRLHQASLAFRAEVVSRFTRLLLSFRAEMHHPDPELSAEFAIQLALGFMEQTLNAGRPRISGELLPEGRVAEELERALCMYMGVKAQA